MKPAQIRKPWFAVVGWLLFALVASLLPQSRPATAANNLQTAELCFVETGACIDPDFAEYWQRSGGLPVFGYPLEAAKTEQTPEGTFKVQYFERHRLELHPEKSAPYNIELGRINDEVLRREGRDWSTFRGEAGNGNCTQFGTGHSVCGAFLRMWRSEGLNLGDPGISYRESLALWGLPLSSPREEVNIDGDTVRTQHFERARMELHDIGGNRQVLMARLGFAILPVQLQILAINDFHGQISTGRTVSGKNAGGAAYLAAYLKQRRDQVKNTLLVHGGDAIGASPPSSALLQDQPTMDFLNYMGFDVGVPGNHEFDEGPEELFRLLEGGCHPVAGCWEGTNFPYVATNIVDKQTGELLFEPYVIVERDGMRIGVIGAGLETTPQIVIPSAVADISFLDEADSINKYIPELREQGVEAIVALVHSGCTPPCSTTAPPTGEIVDIANRMDDAVDIIVSGHTHAYTNAEVDGKLIVQAYSYSTAFADIDARLDRVTGDFMDASAEIVTTFHEGMTPDPEVAAMVQRYEEQVAPQVNQVVGTAATTLTNEQNAAGESPLGNLIADAQRWRMNTQFAFMNPGGIRAPIDAGEVTWGELYAVQPFNNDLVKMELTGAEIYQLLNQQWQQQSDGNVRIRFLQISGLSYTWNDANPIGSKIVEVRDASGTPLDMNAMYSITVNSFLADGGDNFVVLRNGRNRVVGPVDLDALVEYIRQLPQPFSAAIEGRITKQ